jgi:hypothetical protein
VNGMKSQTSNARLTSRTQGEGSQTLLLGWTATLYVSTTVIEYSAFSLGSAQISRIAAFIFVAAALLYATSNRVTRLFNPALISLLGITTIVGLTSLTTMYPEVVIGRLGTFGLLTLSGAALTLTLVVIGSGGGIMCIQRGLIIGATFVSVLIIAARARGDFTGTTQYQRFESRVTAGDADPNSIALVLAIALPACLWSRNRLVRYVLGPTVFLAIVFTGSRGALISVAAGGVAAAIVLARNSPRPFRQTVQSIGFASAAIALAWALLPEALIDRFAGLPAQVTAGTMTRRTQYWGAAWEQFGESPFWGTGPGSGSYLNYLRTGHAHVFHNTHLSFLVDLGLAGWLFFMVALIAAWAGALRSSRVFGWPVVSMAVLTVGSWALSWEGKKVMWVMLIMCCALLTYPKSVVRESDPNAQ